MARPSKLNDELQARIVKTLSDGNYADTAARANGISPSTYYRWLQLGESDTASVHGAFLEAVRTAEAAAEVAAVTAVRSAMPEDWRAAVAFLERRHPARWARREAGRRDEATSSPEARAIDLSELSSEDLATLEELLARIAHIE